MLRSLYKIQISGDVRINEQLFLLHVFAGLSNGIGNQDCFRCDGVDIFNNCNDLDAQSQIKKSIIFHPCPPQCPWVHFIVMRIHFLWSKQKISSQQILVVYFYVCFSVSV